MSLRLTAERVDQQLQDYMQLKQIAGPWKSAERLMVAVSPSPLSERLIRWTRRMAYNLEAPWLAVSIDTVGQSTPQEKERLARNLALARELGAEVITTAERNVIQGLLRVARQRNVTQIVVGKPSHNALQDLLRGGSLVNHLVRASGDIDVFVITGDDGDARAGVFLPTTESHSRLPHYITAAVITGVITAINLALNPMIGYQAAGLTFLLGVLLVAAYVGRGPALFAAVLSALAWDFLFIEPQYTLTISRIDDIFLVIMFFLIALFAGNLTARIRSQERQSRYNAERMLALYALMREIAAAVTMDDVVRSAISEIARVFDARVAILLRDSTTGKLSRTPHPSSTLPMEDKELSVALWSFEHARPAGRFTDTLPLAGSHCIPLKTPSGVVGVLGICTEGRLSIDEESLLQTFVAQAALGIEREFLDEAAAKTQMLTESERLLTTLLNSISHELRSPLHTIRSAAGQLLNERTPHSEYAQDIQQAAERLNRLAERLLDMSQLESGHLNLKMARSDVRDLVMQAVESGAGRPARSPADH
ncbi:MAG: DUF4118 domain-containing protein [Blastochloris sp.]|nr:DUF4118 domain-containing protein [Blastochloris sp.]